MVAGRLTHFIKTIWSFRRRIYIGRIPDCLENGGVILFPAYRTIFFCGLAGIVAFRKKRTHATDFKRLIRELNELQLGIQQNNHEYDSDAISQLYEMIRAFKTDAGFIHLFYSPEDLKTLSEIGFRIKSQAKKDAEWLEDHLGIISLKDVTVFTDRIESLKDIAWAIIHEIIHNNHQIERLIGEKNPAIHPATFTCYRQMNAVLNSIDRLEVRGRDSAGLSFIFILSARDFRDFESRIAENELGEELSSRTADTVLKNNGIQIRRENPESDSPVTIAMVYKTAAEIGRLGDNVRFIRRQVQNDAILKIVCHLPHSFHTILSHTRWASVGAITEANCHPLDNETIDNTRQKTGIIHVCLNGDIDNYLSLKDALEANHVKLHPEITSDTKVIALQIDQYLQQGFDITEAFRLSVNDFEGSHAISMHTDLAPGKLFLAQKGSGQAVFIGLAPDHYMAVSEVYGFVEETSRYLKLDGETEFTGETGPVKGQIYILDQASAGGLSGIRAMSYDGTIIQLTENMIRETDITSRDIDRQHYEHYFLKEISESPISVEKTLNGRWRISSVDKALLEVRFDEKSIPDTIRQAVSAGNIRRVYFIGQGTAGIAASVIADILSYYLDQPGIQVSALKSSELSGFKLASDTAYRSLDDALVVAVSQSGTTTDTNRTVDMIRERGARTLAIVNRRDSDLTFKVDGVIYTSSGRDIEMSVASTKAFYSQIVAGAMLGLFLATLIGRRDALFISEQIRALKRLPQSMRKVMAHSERIEASARDLAPRKTYWATVGSGLNKAAADEIRIKLSELCYKTISSDYTEDKKHIDLSAEPLIIVCAAGSGETVIGDVIKDTAIFRAHKASPVVITDEGEKRFNTYSEHVIHVPLTPAHLAPVLNTLAGHLWGYYAALSINDASGFLYEFQTKLEKLIRDFEESGLDLYEIFLEKEFRIAVSDFYQAFQEKRKKGILPVILGIHGAAELTLLCKYLTGRLPVSDFELDFGKKGTARNMMNLFFNRLGREINALARPIDAIKHQAKTVTVGTSRIHDKTTGPLFDALKDHGIQTAHLTPNNIVVLRNLQSIVADINGSILYDIGKLNTLGEISDDTTINILGKRGILKPLPSRVETDNRLKGTKKIIVREGNVYIGKGRKDDRSIIIVPTLKARRPGERAKIDKLLLLTITFKPDVSLSLKIVALGGKGERIKNIVQENNIPWDDTFLEIVPIDRLFGRSAEKIAEDIVQHVNSNTSS